MTVLVVALLLSANPLGETDTAVVCPREFLPALKPWVEHRQQQGHVMALIDNRLEPAAIRKQIQGLAKSGKLRSIVLVGDADPASNQNAKLRAVSVPTFRVAAKVNVKLGSEPEIATDNNYADLDGDSVPDVAIGRIPADSAKDLEVMVKKIIDYERNGYGRWCRRLNFVAGVGGFGMLADSVLEMSTKHFLTTGIPSSYCTSMTYGSWRSPYCPDPRRFSEVSIDRHNEGCLFWVYIGHGQKYYLDRVRVPGKTYHIMDVRDADQLRCQEGRPIAVFLACYTGAYDGQRDCLAEEMIRRPGGPVAVLSGSRVTMPYAMAIMSDGLMNEYFEKQRVTLGEAVLNAKRKMIQPTKDNANRRLLDQLAAALSPLPDQLPEERREHLHLFNLIGDPLLRLPHPPKVELSIPKQAYAGRTLKIKGIAPIAGKLTLELAVRRDRLKIAPPYRSSFKANHDELSSYDVSYKKANDRIWHTKTVDIPTGAFSVDFEVPGNARNICNVRAIVEDEKKQLALGGAEILIETP